MDFVVIIPARYASTRLPGKPLLPLAGRPMIQHVYERATASGATQVVIATDDLRIQEMAEGFGAQVLMTSADHVSGTARLAEAAQQLGCLQDAIVVNLQGDEPLMPAQLVRQVAEDLEMHADASMATLCTAITDIADVLDSNVVKVVRDHAGYANYFSRAPIPWERDSFSSASPRLSGRVTHYRHIGLYAYRAGFLQRYVSWPSGDAEAVECLEQLRVLEHGLRIHVAEAKTAPGPGVDTAADLERAAALLSDFVD